MLERAPGRLEAHRLTVHDRCQSGTAHCVDRILNLAGHCPLPNQAINFSFIRRFTRLVSIKVGRSNGLMRFLRVRFRLPLSRLVQYLQTTSPGLNRQIHQRLGRQVGGIRPHVCDSALLIELLG